MAGRGQQVVRRVGVGRVASIIVRRSVRASQSLKGDSTIEVEHRIFKGDRWTRLLGSRIPEGASVEVLRFFPRRRVLVLYQGEPILTMLWCLRKL